MKPISLSTRTVALAMLGLAASGVLVEARNAGAVGQVSEATVTIDNFTFAPQALRISPGTRVTWINRDDIPHAIVSSNGPRGFKSPPLDTGDKFSMQFEQRGEYRYFCSIHPMMTATIVVR